jgi:hypothetical protein
VFVLAYNLARPGTLERGVYGRTMSRLARRAGLGALRGPRRPVRRLVAAQRDVHAAGRHGHGYLVERGGKLHLAAAGVVPGRRQLGRILVAGRGLRPGRVVATRRPSWAAAAVAVLACAALWFINRNLWALAALPVLFLASRVEMRVPRLRWAFYAYYPLHLAALWLIRIPMSKAGYLFF